MKYLLIIAILVLSVTSLVADTLSAEKLSIDLLRLQDGGKSHSTVRCGSGPKDPCDYRVVFEGKTIESIKIPKEKIRKIVNAAFDSVPAREISSELHPLPRIPKSPLHWRIERNGKFIQGGFLLHPTPALERSREPLERSILGVEAALNSLLLEKLHQRR